MTNVLKRIIGIVGLSCLVFVIAEFSTRQSGFKFTGDSLNKLEIFELDGDSIRTRKEHIPTFFPQSFEAHKADNIIRIFIIGGSNICRMGDFEIVKKKLQSLEGLKFEIINAGGSGFGSTQLCKVFDEVIKYSPDLIVFHSGGNEFLGYYFRENFLTPYHKFFFSHSRFYQFFYFQFSRFFTWLMTKLKKEPVFKVTKEEKIETYNTYKKNLEYIAKKTAEHNIKFIVSTVAFNRIAPPNFPEATNYEACNNIIDPDEKRACLELAISQDVMPTRATTQLNQIIKTLAASERLSMIPFDSIIVSVSENHIPGYDLFEDHCHLNEQGMKIFQEVLADTLSNYLNNISPSL